MILNPGPVLRGPVIFTRFSRERLPGAPGQNLIKKLLQEVWVRMACGIRWVARCETPRGWCHSKLYVPMFLLTICCPSPVYPPPVSS